MTDKRPIEDQLREAIASGAAKPDHVALWRPQDDECEMARGMGLVAATSQAEHEATLVAVQDQVARDLPGVRVTIYRWPVARVLEAMRHLGAENDPAGRAQAIGWLANCEKQGDVNEGR